MKKRDDYSPEVSSQVEDHTEINAADAFIRRSEDGVSLDEVCQKVIRAACKAAHYPYRNSGVLPFEDLSQEVMLRILNAKRPYQGNEKLWPFAYRIAKNHLINLYHKSKRCKNAAEVKAGHDECRERSEAEILDHVNLDAREINRNYVEDHELRMIAAEEFQAQLTPRQQTIMQLLDEGYEQTEIADSLGVSPQAISRCRSRINRKLWIYLNSPNHKSFVKSP